ncbi:hypothetical protein HQ325_16775 [Rhodococcus sp. BP-349]|uniref:hypothetical protein n=1 Tax=unclassified Rhodococcus (in: high G+C Gram-positive bacteria) TaxID=192944 RepID=UPI001C9BB2EF|nr:MULTISPECIES: hypothetical protein [unclassified Rhodococcus (in: high G+C Gram-positive bacteria)]MBY6540330.1 hypothetical protein [Rhodococcus sp. BP-363]MBY6545645.1 hypothetical protein [Rhodococcus sp. BP-369]MBY6564875.1 hypothetical protein [Rhodococcus sp. BP-370]MBY6578189.1 hypothetical protein [Rhodococcus sp. BP-364]MBY6587490.1 hypothetical protein [Rhodococcus sp. BP-358]
MRGLFDADRPAVLRVVESKMRTSDGLLARDLIDRVSKQSGVAREVIVQRWGTGASLIADMVSEKAIAAPEYPREESFSGASREVVLAALVAALGRSLSDDVLARSAMSQALVSPLVRGLWFDFVREALEEWAAILASAAGDPDAVAGRDDEARAVVIAAGQCYARVVLSDVTPVLSDGQIVELAMTVFDGPE